MDFLKSAMPYAQLGFKVFPLRPGSKEAFTEHGVYDASGDPVQIEEWGREYPNANIAVGCGPESGICVVDIDKHHGGDETMKALIRRHGECPKGPLQRTPQGGFHQFFAYDKRVGNSVGVLGKGLDMKSKGGYVVLAPSVWDGHKRGVKVSDGGVYRWIRAPRGNHLPFMSGWMIKAVMPKPVPPFAKRQIDHSDASVAQVEKVLSFVSNHDYGVWIKIGMAIKAQFGDAGFNLWANWSSGNYSSFNVKECEAKWRSFKRKDGINIGSVFYEARKAGADLRADRSVR